MLLGLLLFVRFSDTPGMVTQAAIPCLFMLGWWRNRVLT
jgi:hypothetical protein